MLYTTNIGYSSTVSEQREAGTWPVTAASTWYVYLIHLEYKALLSIRTSGSKVRIPEEWFSRLPRKIFNISVIFFITLV